MAFLKPVIAGRKVKHWLVWPSHTLWGRQGAWWAPPVPLELTVKQVSFTGKINVPFCRRRRSKCSTDKIVHSSRHTHRHTDTHTHTHKIPDVVKKRNYLPVIKVLKFLVLFISQPIFSRTMIIFSSQCLLLALVTKDTLTSGWWKWFELKILEWQMPLFILGLAIWDCNLAAVVIICSCVKTSQNLVASRIDSSYLIVSIGEDRGTA